MVCLETDFLVALIRKDSNAVEKLRKLVESGERLATTPINAAELFKGAYRSKNLDENLKKVRGILNRLDLLDFNINASDIYGQIISELEKKGEPIGEMDTLIASIALAHNERIVTRNVKHFSRIKGLEIESW
ncbi:MULTISPECIES: type II toxin-antitoxin system VapC family toxin [unclassified Archaeoglobus]|jgi:tRNA(fMet)-specific endonuclease VapC|uniref:type II toxin-antitoxin system VapC family toxin n=1 Tax=unclassified Archaeoglobus TaxID=2643606 RepID=UPI0025BB8C55|nr:MULTISPECIES: type II toxin-antitoxin system VapC family toxin [unclassified Archaeoglobus]